MNIISLSRRTDIPAWYGAWFANRLEAGFATYRNPFGGTIHRVSLEPKEVIAFAFWTRNALPFLPVLKRCVAGGYRSFFLYTITGYGSPIENGVPPTEMAIDGFKAVSKMLGPECVRWRYDPILFSKKMDSSFHLENFEKILKGVAGSTRICHTSFVQFYKKTDRRLTALAEKEGDSFFDPPAEEKIALARELRAMAASHGVRLVSCCTELLGRAGVAAGACVDSALIARLRPDIEDGIPKPHPTRGGCLCAQSRDIGAYNTCLGECVYCYATAGAETARRAHAAHDPEGERL